MCVFASLLHSFALESLHAIWPNTAANGFLPPPKASKDADYWGGRLEWNVKNFTFKNSDCQNTQSSGSIKTCCSLYSTLYIMSMDQKMSQCILFQWPQKCQNDVAGHFHPFILFSNDPELYKKKFTVVRHPCRLTTLPSNTRVSLSWNLTMIPISLGRHLEETRAFLMSARSLEMLRDTSEVISSNTMFGS